MQPARVRFAWGCAALAFLAAFPAASQTPSLVADLATGTPWSVSPPLASSLLAGGGKLFFSTYPSEPAVADAAGTGSQLLADLCPGDCGSGSQFLGTVGASGAPGTIALFVASPGVEDASVGGTDTPSLLYRTDGTRAGTYSLGVPLALPNFFPPPLPTQAFVDGIFYFSSCGDSAGFHCDLWRTDGSLAGTRRVQDLAPQASGPLRIGSVTAVGSRIFFFLSTGGQTELWTTDGTDAGTVRLAAGAGSLPVSVAGGTSHFYFFAPTPEGTIPANTALWASDGTVSGTRPVTAFPGSSPFPWDFPLRVLGDRAYFIGDDVLHGDEIWASDGTPESTRRVTEFGYYTPFTIPGQGSLLLPVEPDGGRLVFAATDGLHGTQLWTSVGTPESTALLPVPGQVDPSSLALLGGRAVFWAASDGNFSTVGKNLELWETDGTPAGTRRLAAACPEGCFLGRFPSLAGGFFLASDAQGAVSLWTTDGTPAGTRRFSDPFPFLLGGGPLLEPVALGGRLFFTASGGNALAGDLWTSDGRPGGTRPVPGLAAGGSSSPGNLVPFAGDLFFLACDGKSQQIYQTSGTAESTVRRSSLEEDPFGRCDHDAPQGLTATSGAVFFWHLDLSSGSQQLWRTDTAGDTRFTGAMDSSPNAGPHGLTPFGGEVFFVAPGPSGSQIWRSDGTTAGTRVATELAAVPDPALLNPAGGVLYILGSTAGGSTGVESEIWVSDGTAAGTRRVLGGLGEIGDEPSIVTAGSWAFFFTTSTSEPMVRARLWRTDGTAAGTSAVTDLVRGNFEDPQPSELVAYQGNLYFFAFTANGRGLFRSDGTAAGTGLVKEFLSEIASSPQELLPHFPTVFAGRLFFAADDGIHGRELWSSDGTAAGTTLVREVSPGPASAAVADLTVVGDRLYFSAADPVHGAELWQTDGSAAGTRLVADLAPESASSSPESLTAVGNRLYFVADDGIAGRELWTLDTAATSGCQAGDTRLCLGAGRFQVEAEWMDFEGNTGVGHAVSLTADTGYFWFFAPTNVETVVKVLDGRALNGAFWVFYGALSNVSYTLTVTDTASGLSRRYINPPGAFASVGDTDGFGPLGAYGDAKVAPAPTPGFALASARTDARAATGTCTPEARRLCLQGGRFAVTAAWQDFQGKTGTGTAVSLTPDTGYFWFFDPTNVEVVTKVLDGTALNGKFWFFYGALSDVAYTLTVTDTRTGAVKTYKNPSGQFGSLGDTGAF